MRTIVWIAMITLFSEPVLAQRASSDPENVKRKKYPKRGKLQLEAIDTGQVLNQAFVDTYLIHTGFTYFSSEAWGYNLELSYGINQDRSERECVETFYNNQDRDPETTGECDAEGGQLSNSGKSNYGPAYIGIRELNYLTAANLVWNPVYGKQIFFLSTTNHFDIFVTMGLGLAFSTYYPESQNLRDGRPSRASVNDNGGLEGGANKGEEELVGESGRPDPNDEQHLYLNLGIGQRLHFWERYFFKLEFRDMVLLGTPGGFENYLAFWFGLGMRF